MAEQVYDYPGKATAEQGVVMLDGPDGIAIAMTPHSAEQTARALLRAAEKARAQGSANDLSG